MSHFLSIFDRAAILIFSRGEKERRLALFNKWFEEFERDGKNRRRIVLA